MGGRPGTGVPIEGVRLRRFTMLPVRIHRTRPPGGPFGSAGRLVRGGGGVLGAVAGLVVDDGGLEEGELIALDADALVREEQIVLGEGGADAGDEEDGVGGAGVAELDDGALGPGAAV